MIGPISRIILRYVAGAAVAYGLLEKQTAAQIANDPDLIMLIGAGIGLVVEVGYIAAKRLGWST